MEELKPCPFCGGRAVLQQSEAKIGNARFPDGYGGFTSKLALAYEWVVCCSDCGSYGIACHDRIYRNESGELIVHVDGRKGAIDSWNRRAAE